MGAETEISWTDATWNPWWGCVKVSPACDNCYAETFAKRTGHAIWGKDAERRFFGDKHWNEPLRWDKAASAAGVRKRVFCASMADVFEDREDLVDSRERLWGVIDSTPNLDWLLLTKRPMNIRRMYPWRSSAKPNVWLGTTVESPKYLWRIDELVSGTDAVVHFLSMEPLVERIPNLANHLDHIEWVITGGESGPCARKMEADAYREIRDAAVGRGIAFHFKQYGEYNSDLVRVGKKAAGAVLDGREWREFPVVTSSAGREASGDR